MNNTTMPWYVRWVIGTGAWVTAVVLIALGAAFVFALLDIQNRAALAVFGAVLYGYGLWLLWHGASGIFAQQLGIATAAAGAAMIAGGLAAELQSLWAGFAVAILVGAGIVAATQDRILQFLAAALAAGFFVTALIESRMPYAIDFVALATPLGLALLLYPPRRDFMPTAAVLMLTFPVSSLFAMENGFSMRTAAQGGTFARVLHIALFVGLVFLHLRRSNAARTNLRALVFAAIAVIVCLLLPAGGSAAMLILMLSFVIGSKPYALLGSALQAQFIARYYYSLEMNLLDKSLLLMAVGVVLTGAWWLLQRGKFGEAAA
ncbi:MAG: DUF4401 domain-containing protein [Halioglobus sp.]|nr:DUF4401 domain-containing protein [Halioglobus sp.]